MSVLTCYDCDGLFNYGYENRLQMAYKGVMMKPGKSYCVFKGKAKLIKNRTTVPSFCPKTASPHVLLHFRAKKSILDCDIVFGYHCIASFKQTPFSTLSDGEHIAKYLLEQGVQLEEYDAFTVVGLSGTKEWNYINDEYTPHPYLSYKSVENLPSFVAGFVNAGGKK